MTMGKAHRRRNRKEKEVKPREKKQERRGKKNRRRATVPITDWDGQQFSRSYKRKKTTFKGGAAPKLKYLVSNIGRRE